MDLNKFKAENFWLRAGLTIMIMIWLTSLAVINRGVITERKSLMDSTAFFKAKCDTLLNANDSLYQELFNEKAINGRYELSLDFLKRVNEKGYQQFQNYYNTQTE